MNLQQLQYIAALDKHRHFGKAADECNVTQPTLSTMVLKLEEELGVKLFDRSRQHIEPTTIGKKIIAQAGEILRQASLIEDIITSEKGELQGDLTIAILPTIAPFLLPRIIPPLEKVMPDLRIRFIEMMTHECIASLVAGDVDMAIIASSMAHEKIDEKILYYEEFFGYVSPKEDLFKKDVIKSSEVEGKYLWLLDEGHCFRDQLVKFCQLREVADHQFLYSRGSLETFIHLVERGYGMTFVPELFVDLASPEQKKLIRPFAIPKPTRAIYLCKRKDFVRSSIWDLFQEVITSNIPEKMLKLKVGQRVPQI